MSISRADTLLIVLAFFLPCASVAIKRKGFCNFDVFLNILFMIMLHIPAIIHAVYIVVSNPDDETLARLNRERRDEEARLIQRPANSSSAGSLAAQGSSERQPPPYESLDNKIQSRE